MRKLKQLRFNAGLIPRLHDAETPPQVLDLGTGQARLLGTVSDGRALWGMAIEP